MTTSGTRSDNEWQRVLQRVTTNNNGWQRVVQRETTSVKEWHRVIRNHDEWQWMATNDNKWQRVTTNDSEWQRVVILTNFPFFRIREEPTTMYPKVTDVEERLLN